MRTSDSPVASERHEAVPFAIHQEERGTYYLIAVTGNLGYHSLRMVREAVQTAMEIGHIYVAFELSNAGFVDSGGIGLLVNLNKKLMKRGGAAYLVGVPESVLASLETGGVLRALPCLSDLNQADAQIG